MQIFVLNGYAKAGKTYFGTTVGSILQSNNVNFLHTSSIDPIKTILKPEEYWEQGGILPADFETIKILKNWLNLENDWCGMVKDEYWRGKMSDLKHYLMWAMPNFVDNWVLNQVKDFEVAFVDIREPSSIEAFYKYASKFGYTVNSIFLEREGVVPANNRSDDYSIRNFPYEHTIQNPGTPEGLCINAHNFLSNAGLICESSLEINNS